MKTYAVAVLVLIIGGFAIALLVDFLQRRAK